MTDPVPSIMEKLNALRKKRGILEKKKMLAEYLQDDDFIRIVQFALDDDLRFKIRNVPKPTKRATEPDFEGFLEALSILAEKNSINMDDKLYLSNFCCNEQWDDLARRIVQKDLKCGVHKRLINHVEPGLLTIYPYMRCSLIEKADNVDFPAIVQEKVDNLFANIIRRANSFVILTRNGNELTIPSLDFHGEILKLFPYPEDSVFMGELRYLASDGSWTDRKKGNGFINRGLKANGCSMTKEIADRIRFVCWDWVPEKDFWEGRCDIPYRKRLRYVRKMAENPRITKSFMVETYEVDSIDGARDFAKDTIADGGEGAVLKDYESIWTDSTSTRWIKLKKGSLGDAKECECELRVVDWNYGKKWTDFATCLGNLVCESEDGKLKVRVGSGLTHEDRLFLGHDSDGNPIPTEESRMKGYIEETFLGKIITVRFNEVIRDKKNSPPRLFLPRYIETRLDKDEADTLEYIESL
jgi:hypothetical protein